MGAPETVTTQMMMNKAADCHRIAMITEELDRTPVVTVRSRRLRRERDQLEERVEAWHYLIVQAMRYKPDRKEVDRVPEVR